MKQKRILLPVMIFMCAVLSRADSPPPPSEGASQPASAEAAPDLCKDAVDPYDSGKERTRFLRAAGVDNELSREEFEADRKAADPFVRRFDKWEAILSFDKNANRTIDWFEAEAYRKDLRGRILGAFDADGSGGLTGKERDEANRSLADGKIPRGKNSSDKPDVIWTQPPANVEGGARAQGGQVNIRRPGGEGSEPGNTDQWREQYRQRYEEWQKSMLEKYDADRDGKLDEKERQAQRDDAAKQAEEWRRKYELQRYDKDGNGQLDEEEQAQRDRDRAEQEKRMAEWQAQAEERRKEWLKEWDTDGDGQLSEEETQRMRDTYRQRGEEARREFVKKWDADGDGKLSEQENETMRKTFREKFEQTRKEMDADGDGQVSAEEYRAYQDKLTKKYDADGDGKLSGEERQKMLREESGSFFGGFPGGGFGGAGRPGDGQGPPGRGRFGKRSADNAPPSGQDQGAEK